jgi:hypothetical protein
MSKQTSNGKEQLKTMLKSNIAKAWYKLDSKSYNQWLEGRKISKSKLGF